LSQFVNNIDNGHRPENVVFGSHLGGHYYYVEATDTGDEIVGDNSVLAKNDVSETGFHWDTHALGPIATSAISFCYQTSQHSG
jgi:hypothetical protein